jgi:hypothetical protein
MSSQNFGLNFLNISDLKELIEDAGATPKKTWGTFRVSSLKKQLLDMKQY